MWWIPALLSGAILFAKGFLVFDKDRRQFREVIRFLWINWPVTSWTTYHEKAALHLSKETFSISQARELSEGIDTTFYYLYQLNLVFGVNKTIIRI